MFFRKNLPFWERTARFAAAALIGLCAARYSGTVTGWVLGVGGLTFAATALVGFCPFCGFSNRRLDTSKENLTDGDGHSN